MDELAVAAATLAVSMDVDDDEEDGVEATSDAVGAAEVLHSILEAKDVDKENQDNPPVLGDQRAKDRKVRLRPSKQKFPPKNLPIASCRHPIRSQAKVASLKQMADSTFPEDAGKPKAVGKIGDAAVLINELVVNAKDAIDELWKARGYLKMKPKQRKEKLGYALVLSPGTPQWPNP